jgi:predicted transposase YbfD/YdcC
MAIPLLDDLDLCGKDLTADALLTQRNLADYLVDTRKAHYHFTVKANQPSLLDDLVLFFNDRQQPNFVMLDPPDHGRIETRQIWTTTELNGYLDFPHLGQAFAIERITLNKKTGQTSHEIAYGITSRSPGQASPQRLLEINRGHWTIENCCHYVLDWVFDEDRSRIRTGYGPENISRLRRFAIGLLQSKGVKNVTQKMRLLNRNIRAVFDYLRLSKNSSTPRTASP